MQKFELDGILYNKEMVSRLREDAIELRNAALNTSGSMVWALSLSHIIVILGKVAEEIDA